MPRVRPPSYVLQGVEFGHLDAEEIRTLSVAKVTQQTTIDEYKTPTHEGLHDLRLGSFQAGRYLPRTLSACPGIR
jgi:DNA-directed RNA polymerase beta' subunit